MNHADPKRAAPLALLLAALAFLATPGCADEGELHVTPASMHVGQWESQVFVLTGLSPGEYFLIEDGRLVAATDLWVTIGPAPVTIESVRGEGVTVRLPYAIDVGDHAVVLHARGQDHLAVNRVRVFDGPPMDAATDGRVSMDSGLDGGPIDAGLDAMEVLDAGFDAREVLDAGLDGGPVDAGFDAGPADAGFDAGPIDAGLDAMEVLDTGFDAPELTDAGFDAGFDGGDAGFICLSGVTCPGCGVGGCCTAACTPIDCAPQCSSGCMCGVDCTAATTRRCDPRVVGTSSMEVDCTAGSWCRATCDHTSTCDVDCTGAASCDVRCEGSARCLVRCAGATSCAITDCESGLVTACPGDIVVCGRRCP